MNGLPSKMDRDVKEAFELIDRCRKTWLEAGKIIAKRMDEDKGFADRFSEQTGIAIDIVIGFQRVGQGKVLPQLLLMNKGGTNCLRRMPIEVQEKYLNEPLPVVIKKGDSYDVLPVAVTDLTRDQVEQVFNGEGVRSEGAQRAWLADWERKELIKVKAVKAQMPWYIQKGICVFPPSPSPQKFTLEQILRIAVEMQK